MPPRYFAGRAPTTPPSSDDDAAPTRPAPRKRARVVARVVTLPESSKASAKVDDASVSNANSSVIDPANVKRAVWEKPVEKPKVSQPMARFEPVSSLRLTEPDSPASQSDSEESQSESSSSYEEQEEQEDVDETRPELPRPVFIAKQDRDVGEKTDDTGGMTEDERKRIRRKEAQRLVESVLREEERAVEGKEELPDDRDREEDKDKEFALWRVRELKRVMRDREEEEEWKRKREEGVRKEEREEVSKEENGEDGEQANEQSAEKSKRAFMQKHYKMGAFFLDKGEDGRFKEEIYNRDYNKGTSADLVGRESLPKPLQVRRGEFGKAGRSKYTHLAAEDTAREFAGEMKRDRELRAALERSKKGKDER